jgi:transposase
MSLVVIGMGPHKRSATIEVMTGDEAVAGGGRYGTDAAGYAAMLAAVKAWPERIWAIEGCQGIGRHLAHRLLADGGQVVDVPPGLSARIRVLPPGRAARPTPPARTRWRWPLPAGQGCARWSALSSLRCCGSWLTGGVPWARTTPGWSAQLHHLLLELLPGGAKKDLSAAQAKVLLAKVRPRDLAGKARRRVAAELTGDLERLYQRKRPPTKS